MVVLGGHTAGGQFGELDSKFIFLIHVPLSSEVVATFGAQDMGVRFVGFGKINQGAAFEAL